MSHTVRNTLAIAGMIVGIWLLAVLILRGLRLLIFFAAWSLAFLIAGGVLVGQAVVRKLRPAFERLGNAPQWRSTV